MRTATHIAHRLREERKQRGWSLDELAARSQVSRAMISKIERGVSSPTAVLLAKLADAMGLPLSALMFEAQSPESGLSLQHEQAQWTDPASGYTRRLVSAAAHEGDAEIVAVELPAGARLGFAANQSLRIAGRVLLMSGRLQMVVGSEHFSLQPGDCARVALHLAHELHNPAAEPARYLVVMQCSGRA